MQSTVDLWSGQRRCIITLTDADVEQMVELFESKQRRPLDVLKKKNMLNIVVYVLARERKAHET